MEEWLDLKRITENVHALYMVLIPLWIMLPSPEPTTMWHMRGWSAADWTRIEPLNINFFVQMWLYLIINTVDARQSCGLYK